MKEKFGQFIEKCQYNDNKLRGTNNFIQKCITMRHWTYFLSLFYFSFASKRHRLFLDSTVLKFLFQGVVAVGWALAAACNLAVLYGLYEYSSGKATEPTNVNAFYQACSRTAWGLGLAWVIFACCRGHGGKWCNVTIFKLLGIRIIRNYIFVSKSVNGSLEDCFDSS